MEAQKTQFDIMAGGENLDNESMYANTPPVVEKQSSKMSEEKRSWPFSELPREARESRDERRTLGEAEAATSTTTANSPETATTTQSPARMAWAATKTS